MTGLVCFRIDGKAIAADILLCLDLYWNNLVIPLDNELHFRRAWRSPIILQGLYIASVPSLLADTFGGDVEVI